MGDSRLCVVQCTFIEATVKIEIITLFWQDFAEVFTALLYLFVIPHPGTCIPKLLSKNSPMEIIPFLSVFSHGFFIFVYSTMYIQRSSCYTLTLKNPFAQESKV